MEKKTKDDSLQRTAEGRDRSELDGNLAKGLGLPGKGVAHYPQLSRGKEKVKKDGNR